METVAVRSSPWPTYLIIIAVLTLLAFLVANGLSVFSRESVKVGNVALIPIKGVILSGGNTFFEQEVASPSEIIGFIEEAALNPGIKAIVLEINSPGGAAVASQEIANTVKAVNKTTVAWIRDSGTSGAYWIASAADTVVASSMSIVGSIGVTASYLQFSGLLKDYNVTYEQLIGGKLKEVGSPFKPLTFEERKMLQEQIDQLHTLFIKSIAENRKLPEEKVREAATGAFFLGQKAKELGLIDVIGGRNEVKAILQQKLNATIEFASYEHEPSFFDILSRFSARQSFMVGRGIGRSMTDQSLNRIDSQVSIWT